MKPIVHYRYSPATTPVVGQKALVFPIDHTSEFVSNEAIALTSRVVSVRDDGYGFETINMIYALDFSTVPEEVNI